MAKIKSNPSAPRKRKMRHSRFSPGSEHLTETRGIMQFQGLNSVFQRHGGGGGRRANDIMSKILENAGIEAAPINARKRAGWGPGGGHQESKNLFATSSIQRSGRLKTASRVKKLK
jgi:hypothetical protein